MHFSKYLVTHLLGWDISSDQCSQDLCSYKTRHGRGSHEGPQRKSPSSATQAEMDPQWGPEDCHKCKQYYGALYSPTYVCSSLRRVVTSTSIWYNPGRLSGHHSTATCICRQSRWGSKQTNIGSGRTKLLAKLARNLLLIYLKIIWFILDLNVPFTNHAYIKSKLAIRTSKTNPLALTSKYFGLIEVWGYI